MNNLNISINNLICVIIKMLIMFRLLRMPLELTVFSHEEAENKMKQIIQLKHANSEKNLFSHRFVSINIFIQIYVCYGRSKNFKL